MSTPFTDPNDHRPAFDRLTDDRNFDEQGMFIKPDDAPPAEGESGNSATPAQATGEQPSAPAEKTTAATQPSPDAKPAPTPDPAKPETKTGEAGDTGVKAAAPGTKPEAEATDTTAAPAADETEEALKARLSKPGDTGNEWQMRAYREGQTLRKKLAPIQTHLDRVGSTDRAARGLDFVAVLAEPDVPIAEAAEKLTKLSESRATDLRNHHYYEVVDHYPDNVLRDVLKDETATIAEVTEALQLKRSGGKAATDKQPQSAVTTKPGEVPKPEHFTDADWEDFKEDYPDTYAAMQRAHAAAATKPPEPGAETPNGNDPNADLSNQVKELRQQLDQRQQDEYVTEVQAEGQKIEAEVFAVVEDRLRELGLDPDPAKDDEATLALKKQTAEAIRKQVVADFEGPNGAGGWDDWSQCSDEQKENRKFEQKMMQLIAKKDYVSARDYIELMQGRVGVTLDRVVDAQMKAYNAAMSQPTEKPRNAGQQGHERPEIVGSAAAAGAGDDPYAKTPWLKPDFKRPGEDGFAAMQRYMESADRLPGR